MHLLEHGCHKAAVLGQRTRSEDASTYCGGSGAASSASLASASDDDCVNALSLLDPTEFELGKVKTVVASESSTGANMRNESQASERLYTCAECGEAPLLGAADEDGEWYCKDCWEAFLSQNDEATAALPAADNAAKSESVESTSSCNESVAGDRLYTCAECGEAPLLGAFDEEDGEWYCKSCWEVLLAQASVEVDDGVTCALAAADLDEQTTLFSR